MTRQSSIGTLVREALLGNPGGLTLKQISEVIGKSQDLVSSSLYRTYGFYISDWVLNENGNIGMIAVWSCVVVPASKPKPLVTEDMKEYQRQYRQKNNAKLAEERKKRIAEMREKAKVANAKIRAEIEVNKAARKAQREESKLAQQAAKEAERAEKNRIKQQRAEEFARMNQPAAPADFVPAKTRWVPVQPWSH